MTTRVEGGCEPVDPEGAESRPGLHTAHCKGNGLCQKAGAKAMSDAPGQGLPRGHCSKARLPMQKMRETGLPSLGRKDPLGGNGNLLQYFLLKKSQGQRSQADYSPWGLRVGYNSATEHTHVYTHTQTIEIWILRATVFKM